MSTAVWTAFAVAGMAGIFATCVVAVVVGVRVLENALAKRRNKASS
jgi:hypothetical protein